MPLRAILGSPLCLASRSAGKEVPEVVAKWLISAVISGLSAVISGGTGLYAYMGITKGGGLRPPPLLSGISA